MTRAGGARLLLPAVLLTMAVGWMQRAVAWWTAAGLAVLLVGSILVRSFGWTQAVVAAVLLVSGGFTMRANRDP